MSFKTSFDLKPLKLEPKLVSAGSETKRLFQLFRFFTETESFGVSIEPKITEEQPKQCNREHILVFFSENLRLLRFVSVCFEKVCFGSIPKQRILMFRTAQPKQFYREHILVFFRKCRVVLNCFETVLFVSVQHRNKSKIFFLVSQNKPKHNQNRSCFVFFCSNLTFCLFVSKTPYCRCKAVSLQRI